jgi:hypothetical protein
VEISKRQEESPEKDQRRKENEFPLALAVSPRLRRLTAKAQATDPEEAPDSLRNPRILRTKQREAALLSPGGLRGTLVPAPNVCYLIEAYSMPGPGPLFTGTPLLLS